MVLHHSEVMVSVSNVSRIIVCLLLDVHLNRGTLAYTKENLYVTHVHLFVDLLACLS